MKTEVSPEEKLIEEFNNLKPLLQLWGKTVDKALIEILSSATNFNFANSVEISPSYRLKDDNSLIKKAFYRKKNYENPILQIQDKVGTRIVVTTRKEVDKIHTILRLAYPCWTIKEEKAVENFMMIDPKQFGYQALHFILKPTKFVDCFSNLEDDQLDLYTCELQVKSLAQHAWAKINHDTTFKGPFETDGKVSRTMAKIMALSEVADDYYVRVIDYMDQEENIQRQFINSLLEISEGELNYKFDKSLTDGILTKDLLDNIDYKQFPVDEVRHVTISNKEKVLRALNSLKSYLKSQPIVIFLYALILLRNGFLIRKSNQLEDYVVRELFRSIGYSNNEH